MIAYFDGRFAYKDEIRISPDDRGFVFADGVYEVIRSYRGKLFRADEHLRRLDRSLKEIRIRFSDTEALKKIADTLIRKNHLETGDATVYIQITRGTAPRKHVFPKPEVFPTVYAAVSSFTPDPRKEQGVKTILVPDIRWSRCDIKTIALLPNVMATQQAIENGADEALFVRDGAITEGSHTNFAAIIDGEFRTYPESHRILSGITRSAVIGLCGQLGIPVREIPVSEPDIGNISEAMILGTTTEVMPVVGINEIGIGDGKPGLLTSKLRQAFRELAARECHGKIF